MERNAAHFGKPGEDSDVSWARRRETIRGGLKLFRVLLAAVRRHNDWVESRHGVSSAHLWAVWELGQTPGMRVVDLAKTMALHRSTVEGLLKDLLARGLVVAAEESDAQATCYLLTREGKRMAESSPEFGQGVLKSALEHLPDAGLAQLVDSLKAVNECIPFREERAALQPLAELLRTPAHDGVHSSEPMTKSASDPIPAETLSLRPNRSISDIAAAMLTTLGPQMG